MLTVAMWSGLLLSLKRIGTAVSTIEFHEFFGELKNVIKARSSKLYCNLSTRQKIRLHSK